MDKIKTFYKNLSEKDYYPFLPKDPTFSIEDNKVLIKYFGERAFIITLDLVKTKSGNSVKYHKLAKALYDISYSHRDYACFDSRRILLHEEGVFKWGLLVNQEGEKQPNPLQPISVEFVGDTRFKLEALAGTLGKTPEEYLEAIIQWTHEQKTLGLL